MITQYDNQTIPSTVLDLLLSKVRFGEEYIIFSTGENEYSLLVKDYFTNDAYLYTVSRSGSNYNYQWVLSSPASTTFDYSVSNEYYVHSNVGVGTRDVLPITQDVQAYSDMVILLILIFFLLFGRVFGWKRRTLL